jgi:hypothetical protein
MPAPCDHAESLYGRCSACGMSWAEQLRRQQLEQLEVERAALEVLEVER